MAFTLPEVLVAAVVALVGFLGVAQLNSAHLRLVKSARQSNAATLCLQERAERLRLADWTKVTSATYLQNTLLASLPKSAAPLDRLSERVTVAAYPDDTVAQKLIVVRDENGQLSTLMSGAGLTSQTMAKVDLEVDWFGSDGRPRTRAVTTLMADGGISAMNLPAFGSAATGTTSSGSASSASSSSNRSNASSGAGRGNINGKSGKN